MTTRIVYGVASMWMAIGCSQTHLIELDPDAGATPPDAGRPPVVVTPPDDPPPDDPMEMCPSGRLGLAALDTLPLHYDAAPRVPSLASDGETFHLAHLRGNPNPCDGPCFVHYAIGRTGGLGEELPAYWGWVVGESTFETSSVGGRALLTMRRGVEAQWQARPLAPGTESWEQDAIFSVAEDEMIAAIAPALDGTVHVAIHEAEQGRDGHSGLHLVEVALDGSTVRNVSYDSYTAGVRQARVIPSRTPGRGPWLTRIEQWDFPPTVQVDEVGVGSDIRGSSCGVEAYDAVELGPGHLAVVQRCGGYLEITSRGSEGTASILIGEDANEDSALAIAVLPDRPSVVVAYQRFERRAPTLLRVDYLASGDWAVAAELDVPLDPDVHTPLTGLDVATLADGTIGVTWVGTPPSGEDWDSSEGAFFRAIPCR